MHVIFEKDALSIVKIFLNTGGRLNESKLYSFTQYRVGAVGLSSLLADPLTQMSYLRVKV